MADPNKVNSRSVTCPSAVRNPSHGQGQEAGQRLQEPGSWGILGVTGTPRRPAVSDQGVSPLPDTHRATLLENFLSLSLSFLICNMGIITRSKSQDCC